MAQHISLKLENNDAGLPFKLYSIGVDTKKLPARNIEPVNYKGDHITLKFQNAVAGEDFQLQTIGLGIKGLVKQ